MKTDLIDKLLRDKKVLVLGHRGSRKAEVPENTLAAFERAFAVGADGIEIDEETTRDGKLVVVNRWFLNAEFGLFPWEGTLEEIQSLGLTKGIAIPTFDETCRLIKKRPRAVFNVEIKSSDKLLCKTAREAVKVIRNYGIDREVIPSSFDINTLLTTRLVHPTIESAYPGYFMRKRSRQSIGVWFQCVIGKDIVVSKMQNVIHGYLFDFLTLRASRVHLSAALSEH